MTDATDIKRAKLDAMLEEYKWLGSDQQLYTQFHRRDAQIFLTLLGILVTLSNIDIDEANIPIPQGIFSMMIPSLIFVYYMMQALNFHVVTFETKQRAKIEQKINDLLDDDLIGWEAVPGRIHLRKPFCVSVVAGTLIFGLLLIVYSLFAYFAYKEYGFLSLILHIIELLCMIGVGILWFKSQNEDIAPNPQPQG